jgi:hypothetical protein
MDKIRRDKAKRRLTRLSMVIDSTDFIRNNMVCGLISGKSRLMDWIEPDRCLFVAFELHTDTL